MSEYGANAIITGSLNVDGNIDLGSGDDDVNLDSNTLFVDADQDKVGIGTTSPSHKFDVNGDIRIRGNDIRDNSGNPAISFDGSANTEINGSLTVDQYIYHSGDADTFVQFANDKIVLKAGNRALVTAEVKSSQPHEVTINDGSNNVDFVVKGNGSNEGNPGMKFDASTNRLGINGVGSPDCELHVDGDVKVVGNDPRIKIDGDTDSHPGLELYENGTRKWIAYNNYTNDNLTFKTNSDVRMVIAQDGNVGIGVGDPDTRLEVFNAGNQLKLSYNASDSATFAVDDNGYLTVTPSGGFASIAGQFGHRKYIKATMSNGNTIGTTESGAVVMQSTASDTPSDVIINLPATAAGVIYTFLFVGNPTHGFQISPDSSDKIMGSVVNAAGGITTASNGGSGTDNKDLILGAGNNSTVGNRVTLVGDGSNGWVILDGYGDWTFES